MQSPGALTPLVECVPNFSEGRDPVKVASIVTAIQSVPKILVLGAESDADHNRSVVTFVGPPAAVAEAALRGIGKAVELIDLTRHSGVHPRIGAADVVPFVPLAAVTLEECAQLARSTAAEVWKRFHLPVFLYEAAASAPERVNLESHRRSLPIESWRPDAGEPRLHPTAGAVAIGARNLLIAFNIYLATSDVSVARAIARTVRASSGGLPCVKALGLYIEARSQAQVSMNLTCFERTGLRTVFEAVRTEADRLGTTIASSELVGFLPRAALNDVSAESLLLENFGPERILENRIEQLSFRS